VPEPTAPKLTPEEAKERIEEHKAHGCLGIIGVAVCLFLLWIFVYLYRTHSASDPGSTIGYVVLIGGALIGLFFAARATFLSYTRASEQARRMAPPAEPMTRAQRAKAILFPPDKPREALPRYRPENAQEQWANRTGSLTGIGILIALTLIVFVWGFMAEISSLAGSGFTSDNLLGALFLAVGLFTIVFLMRWMTRHYHDLRYFRLLKKLPDAPPAPPREQKPDEDSYDRYLRQEAEVEASKNQWEEADATPDGDRPLHIWIPGLPGQGKSTLMKVMAVEDFLSGITWDDPVTKTLQKLEGEKKGVTIIDPHGDLAEGILPWIPKPRIDETVYFDLKNPVPIDFLGWTRPEEKQIVVASIIALFHTFSSRVEAHVGKVMESILYPLLWTLIDGEDVSFLDIYRFLEDEEWRLRFIDEPGIDPTQRNYWRRTRLNQQDTQPISRLLIPIIHNPVLKKVFGCPHSRRKNPPHTVLRISDIFFERKILIANLAHNVPDDPTPHIIAALIIAKLQQAAFSQPGPESSRIPHYIYADEFQKYQVTSDFATLLTEARKFKLCLTMANQRFDQISETTLRGLESVKNWYLFKLHPEDARRLSQAGMTIREKELYNKAKEPDASILTRELAKTMNPWRMMSVREVTKPLPADDLINLQPFHAIHRSGDKLVKRVTTTHWSKFEKTPVSYAEHIVKRTMDLYSCTESTDPLQSSQDDAISPTGPPKNAGPAGPSKKKAVPPDKGKGGSPPNPR